ncbi:hypothetical protein PVAND_007888 [Polypedilum vanderplanki]|uniref:Uncharacterized protein n=1 Tax=Polypedilum vanderplanki TaxID=319348 RepID=A0A9J6C8T3_POLVA|nr:hypothetical protein PVAND_007888 [Polypedilum vanderplanki]
MFFDKFLTTDSLEILKQSEEGRRILEQILNIKERLHHLSSEEQLEFSRTFDSQINKQFEILKKSFEAVEEIEEVHDENYFNYTMFIALVCVFLLIRAFLRMSQGINLHAKKKKR